MNNQSCIVNDCNLKVTAKGLCCKHYTRQLRHGIESLTDEMIELTEIAEDKSVTTHIHTLYYNTQPIKMPDIYNRNNLICQWLTSHHTKRFREDNGLRN